MRYLQKIKSIKTVVCRSIKTVINDGLNVLKYYLALSIILINNIKQYILLLVWTKNMVFTINPTTRMIMGTRGDSGTLSFQFNRDMDGSTVTFVVKKDITTDDANAYITKLVTFPTTDEIVAAGGGNPNNVVAIVLDPIDTINLPIIEDEDADEDACPKYADYVWGLKVTKGTTYVETVVPVVGGCYPTFRLYYNINATTGTVPPASTLFYATTINVDTLTLQPAQVAGTAITLTMASENSGTGKQTLNVPLIWGTVTTLYQYNTIISAWQQISLGTFDLSTIVVDNITYRSYVHNGPTIGSRQLNFTF